MESPIIKHFFILFDRFAEACYRIGYEMFERSNVWNRQSGSKQPGFPG